MIKISSAITLIVLLLGVPPAWAQDPGEVAKLKARIDKLEAENAAIKRDLAELKKTLAAIAAQPRPGPEEEKKTIIGLYNRHCIRCHGLDGRGVWDIPKVPDFTDGRWQASRSNAEMVRTILEGGKGTREKQRDSLKLSPPSKKTGILHWATMPSYRDILTREEVSSMARFVRTFAPSTETPEKDNAKLLGGAWEVVKTAPGGLPVGSVMDFGKEGKLKLAVQEEGQVHKADGTYKVAGNKIAITVNWSADKVTKQTLTIKKISEKELSIEDDKGKGVELKRNK